MEVQGDWCLRLWASEKELKVFVSGVSDVSRVSGFFHLRCLIRHISFQSSDLQHPVFFLCSTTSFPKPIFLIFDKQNH